jgi:hypothetical protein
VNRHVPILVRTKDTNHQVRAYVHHIKVLMEDEYAFVKFQKRGDKKGTNAKKVWTCYR